MEKESQTKLRLAPPEPIIGETDGFAESDIFGYAEFGGGLADIVRNLQTPLVLALTGGWGSGKSVFAKQWAGELRKKWADPEKCKPENGETREAKDAPVIYFDAFANDYQDNAFLALAGEVLAALKKCGAETEDLKNKAADVGKALLSTAANVAVHWATGGATDAGKIAAGVKGALAERLENAAENRVALDDFRTALGKAAEKIGGGQPLVFIVDELDRCRPDFALELLEKIKHLFSVPNVCFLVVTNLEQFKAVVQRAYGYNEKDARVYLDKFFHHVFGLPEAKSHGEKIADYAHYLWGMLKLPKAWPTRSGDRGGEFASWMEKVGVECNLSLRDMERMLAPLVLACARGRIQLDADAYYRAAALCVLRKIEPEKYQQVLRATASWDDMPDVIKNSPASAKALVLLKKEVSANEFAPYLTEVDDDLHKRRKYVARFANDFIEDFPPR